MLYSLLFVFAVGHSLPDGLVDRSVQVIVGNDLIELRYEIVANADTIRSQFIGAGAGLSAAPDGEPYERYVSRFGPVVGRGLKVSVNGVKRVVQGTRSEISRRHHTQIKFIYELQYDGASSPTNIAVIDENFRSVPGYHRMALKAVDNVQIVRSTASGDLRRVPRIPLSQLTEQEKSTSTRIAAMIQYESSTSHGNFYARVLWILPPTFVVALTWLWKKNSRNAVIKTSAGV